MRAVRYLIAPRFAVFDLLWISPAASLLDAGRLVEAIVLCVGGAVAVGLLRLAIEKLGAV